MTYHEFSQQDMELQMEINAYSQNSLQAQQQIIANEIEITRLQGERTKLAHEYALSEKPE